MRLFAWRRSEMSRRSDRVEGRLGLLLVVAFFLVAPLVGAWVWNVAYRSEEGQSSRVRDRVARVEAVLLDDASEPAPSDGTGMPADLWVARARWSAPSGAEHVGAVQVAGKLSAGDRIGLWIDRTGEPVTAPEPPHPGTEAALATTVAVLAVLCALVLTKATVRLVLDRRRMRAWQDEWSEIGPRWTRHR
ncbi:hypothetical protein HH310_13700 [Actinoplanes sp. TBRC 11911]|uniref:Rv1733c family protein n=1 Tax=Actinoplanes sp. TBRC 11911 TaxID=2729386 RepID=UPI00145F5DBD|nr:hypothetical protein [Actinoplanes sp. TBRC 11911]NMO52246.1 hypothetical protein [Actinoplanes sp. TBRC 11911]